MSSNQTEHHLKLTARLEHSADCAQHEQAQTFIGVLAVLCAEIAGEGIADALCAVPFQAVQIVADGVVLVAVGYNGNGFFNLLFAGQSVLVLQIEHEIVQVRVVQGRCRLAPPKGLHNINAFRENIVPDSTLQNGVVLKYGQAVPYAVFDGSLIGHKSRLSLTSSTVIFGCVSCNSPFKFYHLFSLPGHKGFLFFGCAVQKNIQQIFDVAFSLQSFHEQRMPFILRLLWCVLLLPCPEMMEVIGQHLVAPVFFLPVSLFRGRRSYLGSDISSSKNIFIFFVNFPSNRLTMQCEMRII